MQAGVYFVTQSSGDVAKESLKNNIGLKFAFRSTDINEIKQTLEFFGIDKDDGNNQKRLRDLEKGQCLLPVSYTHLDWKLNERWAWFIGDNRQSLKLTTKPEPYTLDRTLRWVQRQVAPTLKMLKKIDKGNGTDYMETIEQQAKLTEKHEMIIKQQTTPAKDLVES